MAAVAPEEPRSVEEPPAPVLGVGEEMEAAPQGQEMERAYEGTARGSIESLGRWNEKKGGDRAMPIKHADTIPVQVGFGKFVDELVQTNASSGILAISNWRETRGSKKSRYEVTVYGCSWSAIPDDTSYQRHGAYQRSAAWTKLAAGLAKKRESGEKPLGFADFEGVVDDLGGEYMAVYRVTLPSGGLDPGKWVGRPPPLAPEDLYTGPRSDGLLSTDEISGEYSAPGCICADGPGYKGCPVIKFCNSMSVVPLGADTIETWRASCCFLPPFIGPVAYGEVRTRDPGTNAFDGMTFSADGTAKSGCGCFKKRPGSQKRAFHKVETRDLAGKWRGCECAPFVPCWPLAQFRWTEKTALNQDRYEESGHRCCLALPLPCSVESTTRTRVYVNGHPTNGFAKDGDIYWYRDPGCAANGAIFAKKVG